MNLPPGSSDFWRLTWGSSIYGSSRPSTISLVLDEQLPNFGQDDTSGQLSSSIALLFQLFENSRPDAQIKSDLRTLLQHAGDVAARILVNARNNSRKLPLEFTIERGLYGTCRELLDFGADVSKRSSTGKSLPKLARRIQRRTAEDMPEYYAVGICHQLLMDYSTAPNAKTIERRKKLGSIAKRDKRDSLASIKESFTYPPPSAPLPPVSHRHFSWESSRAATTQLNLPENCSFDPPPNYRPPIERQRNGVSQLVNHFDALGSNKGYSSLSLEAEIYRQPGDEDNVRVLPRTRPPAHNFESYMMSGALDESAATHYPHGSSADNLVHPLQTGKYLELDGQVVIAFPVQAQVSDLQRLNSFSQFLYPSRAAHSWILGPPFDPLNMDMATFQATGQEDSLPPYPQIPVTNGRNDIIYENQGYNRQGDIALQEQQQQGPFQPSAGDATPNFPADGTFSYSGYLSSSPAPIQNEMEEFNFGFKFDNLENNETAQYC
ncbi:hypothetical protein V496_06858 [Pseudogymnoascus sp. VKM F-4515 (FW-2607)]|nr:hypothetical protein V496_06858 [Pseudogymnoascus sp. VKM F-4515 (FW-2607)]